MVKPASLAAMQLLCPEAEDDLDLIAHSSVFHLSMDRATGFQTEAWHQD